MKLIAFFRTFKEFPVAKNGLRTERTSLIFESVFQLNILNNDYVQNFMDFPLSLYFRDRMQRFQYYPSCVLI